MNFLNKPNNIFIIIALVVFISASLFILIGFSTSALAQEENPNAGLTSEYQDSPFNKDFQLVPTDCGGKGERECGWNDLLRLIKKIMAFLFYISAFLATISFAYAGFLYVTAFGEMGKVEQAHSIFTKVIVGMLFVFLAWLIVATMLRTLGVQDAFSLLNLSGIPSFEVTEGSGSN